MYPYLNIYACVYIRRQRSDDRGQKIEVGSGNSEIGMEKSEISKSIDSRNLNIMLLSDPFTSH